MSKHIIDYTKANIMEQSRHQFLYGQDGKLREEFLRELEKDYPIKTEENRPMAIYMNDFSLPIVECKNELYNRVLIESIARNYFEYSIIYNVICKIVNDNIYIRQQSAEKFIEDFNEFNLADNAKKLHTLKEISETIKESMDYYKTYYQGTLNGDNPEFNFNDLQISFMEAIGTVEKIKRMLNNSSYFGIIIDNQKKMPLASMQSINCFTGSRVNRNISMKIATEHRNWESFIDLSGNIVEMTHDYGTIDIDKTLSLIKK